MKTKKVETAMLLFILSICLIYGLTACGSTSNSDESSKSENTFVGNWSHIDESKAWTIGFTEDGDFYDSSGNLMKTFIDTSYFYSKYGSWHIRADGRLWFTTSMTIQTTHDLHAHTDEYSWGYTYELDGDSLTIGDNTFTRIK